MLKWYIVVTISILWVKCWKCWVRRQKCCWSLHVSLVCLLLISSPLSISTPFYLTSVVTVTQCCYLPDVIKLLCVSSRSVVQRHRKQTRFGMANIPSRSLFSFPLPPFLYPPSPPLPCTAPFPLEVGPLYSRYGVWGSTRPRSWNKEDLHTKSI